MKRCAAIAVLGTFDSKSEEHLLLKRCIEQRGFPVLTINVGTKRPSPFRADHDLYAEVIAKEGGLQLSRDKAIHSVMLRAQTLVKALYEAGRISGIISGGGGTGTHLSTRIMRVLPLGVPKVMVSTVASRNMADVVGTKDVTMMHSVVDLLGVNSISGTVLDRAAGAVCGMVQGEWKPRKERKRIALTMFGFITKGAEFVKKFLEEMGYEVIAFHANGTGGMAMEELAAEGYFDGILDFATHELADELKGGYCAGIGSQRLLPAPGSDIPRLVVPGGLDCAVLEFTRDDIPDEYKDRKIFFYDFRSAIRLNAEESEIIAAQLADKLSRDPSNTKLLVPSRGWSEADRLGGPLYDPTLSEALVQEVKKKLDPQIEVKEVELHINDADFGKMAAKMMDEMLKT